MTPIEKVTDKFIKKIKQDVEYFLYDNISEEDTLEIINERTNDLFEMACDELESQLDQIDFNDITDTDFNIDLTRTEIDTISDMMKYKYMEEHLVRLRKFQTYLGKDINNKFSHIKNVCMSNSDLSNIDIRPQEELPSGRIDLLIKFNIVENEQKEQYLIALEAKLDSLEHDDQCKKYRCKEHNTWTKLLY